MQTLIEGCNGPKQANSFTQEGFCRAKHRPPIWSDGLIGGDGRQLAHHIYMEYRGHKPLREER